MTFTDTRADLALQLSTVPGVNGHVRKPKVPTIGDAWPLLESANRGPGDAFQGTWRVLVFLGGDEFAATTFLDDTLPLLVAALDPVAFVDSARPALTAIQGTDAYVVELIVRSE